MLLYSLGITVCSSLTTPASAADHTNTTGETASLSVSGDVSLDLVPTSTGTVGIGNTNVLVTTDSTHGYHLLMSGSTGEDGYSPLYGPALSGDATLNRISSITSDNALAGNTWGYTLPIADSTNQTKSQLDSYIGNQYAHGELDTLIFSPVQTSPTTITTINSPTPTTGDTTAVYVGVKVGGTNDVLVTGNYNNSLVFTTIVEPNYRDTGALTITATNSSGTTNTVSSTTTGVGGDNTNGSTVSGDIGQLITLTTDYTNATTAVSSSNVHVYLFTGSSWNGSTTAGGTSGTGVAECTSITIDSTNNGTSTSKPLKLTCSVPTSYADTLTNEATYGVAVEVLDTTNTGTNAGHYYFSYWMPNVYTITLGYPYAINYDANGGSNSPTATTGTAPIGVDTNITLSSSTPASGISGVEFIGWATSPTATTVEYTPSASYTINNTDTNEKVVNLYAIWSGNITEEIAITADNISDYFTVTNGTTYYFAGSGNVFTSNNNGVNSSTATTTLTAKQDLSVSFNYSYSSEASYDKFTLVFGGTTVESAVSGATTNKSYSGSLTTGQTISFTYSKDGSVNGNDDKCTFSDMIITISVTGVGYLYTINYNANGGTNAPVATAGFATYGTPITLTTATPARDNYGFIGWAATNEATTAAYPAGSKYSPSSYPVNETLYAVWGAGWTATINYNANGGSSAPTTTTTTLSGDSGDVTLSTTKASYSGHLFAGWATSSSATIAAYKAGETITVSQSSPTVTLYAVWDVMQGVSCSDFSSGTTYTVIDARFTTKNKYYAGKLSDGKCWMLQNLYIPNGTTLTSSTSNVSSNYSLPSSSTSGWSSDTTAYYYAGTHIDATQDSNVNGGDTTNTGSYFSFIAATVGTGTGSGGNVDYSVCPKGWRLPTGGPSGEFQALYTAYSSNTSNFNTAFKYNATAHCDMGGCPYSGTTSGFYWSSTMFSGAYLLLTYASGTNPSSYSDERYGRSVRCVLAS